MTPTPRRDESTPAVEVRPAAPTELPQLQAIDAAASALFEAIGIHVNLSHTHPFVTAEAERWALALAKEQVLVAVDTSGVIVGFAVVGQQDDAPYLDQLSVHPTFMRRGIGGALLREVIRRSGALPLWLTTYAHVAWNAPFYAKFGFRVVLDVDIGPELTLTLKAQRAALPHPEQRVAMLRAPDERATR
jgi:ribosomal protein S18 acetylase RimI-like enzyme